MLAGLPDLVQAALQRGADANARNKRGDCVLSIAIGLGSTPPSSLPADPSCPRSLARYASARPPARASSRAVALLCRHKEIARLLVQHGARTSYDEQRRGFDDDDDSIMEEVRLTASRTDARAPSRACVRACVRVLFE